MSSDGPSTVRRLMVVVLTLVVLIAGGGALALWLSRRLTDHGVQTAHVLDQLLAARNTEVDGRLQAITATMDRRLGELDTKVDRASSTRRSRRTRFTGSSAKSARRRCRWPSRRKSSASCSRSSARPRRAAASASYCSKISSRLAAADRLRAPVRLRGRRARGRGDQGRPDRPDRLELPPRQLRADARGRERPRTSAVRESSSRVTSRATSTRSPRSTSAPTRGRTTSPSCTCRRRRSTTSSRAGRTGALLAYAHEKPGLPVSPTTLTA